MPRRAARTAAAVGGGSGDLLNGVSCVSAADCTGAGFYSRGANGTIQSLIWPWNGQTWSPVSTPSPSKSEPSQLMGVACSSARACTAVGFIAPFSTSNTKDLIESGSSGS